MHRNLTGDETGYNVDFATRDSFSVVLTVATTAATVNVSLYDAADTQIGETVTRNK